MPVKVATVQAVREIEAAADCHGISYAQLMQNAGEAACQALLDRVALGESTRLLFLIGKGNNGGDGLVMARQLALAADAQPHLYLMQARDDSDAVYSAARDTGLPMTLADDDTDFARLRALAGSADVIVDALLGIGGAPPLRPQLRAALRTVRRATSGARPFVFAIDCPSGCDCDSGDIDAHALHADATISFIAAKPGLLTFPAAAAVGELVVAQLCLPATLPELQAQTTELMDQALAKSLLPARPLDGHKGTFGKAMLVAGCGNYIGAVALAGEGACRSGAGLVTVATTQTLIDTVAGRLREPTWLPLPAQDGAIAEAAAAHVAQAAHGYDALLVGCGLGLHASTQAFVARLLAADALPPLLLDADALNALSHRRNWWECLPPDTILTPHIGEMARLTQLPAAAVSADRWRIAADCAAKWGVALLLKGAHTLVAAPAGDITVIPVKTDALGTAGTGDILAGLIVGLRAQGLAAYDCARLGAYVHALAGTIAARQVGSSRAVIAGDVLAALGRAFAAIESA